MHAFSLVFSSVLGSVDPKIFRIKYEKASRKYVKMHAFSHISREPIRALPVKHVARFKIIYHLSINDALLDYFDDNHYLSSFWE